MGSVHLARKRSVHGFEKLVAVKSIRDELRGRDDMREMFLREARLVARLRHASIAQVYDFGEIDGDAYLVMEYVEGVSFADLLTRLEGPMPPATACRLMTEVCRGLHAAHELKDFDGTPLHVVHRDVSPQNLMLTFDGHVKILDFGIARTRLGDTPVTAVGAVKGKPGYMAPEQLVPGSAIDRRTDVFLAGIVLHELLTGRRLFEADNLLGLAHALVNQVTPPPSRRGPAVPAELDAVTLRSLAREPSERFPTAQEMGHALEALTPLLQGESPEVFAARELAEQRDAHEALLRQLLAGLPVSSMPGHTDAAPPRRAATLTSAGRSAEAPTEHVSAAARTVSLTPATPDTREDPTERVPALVPVPTASRPRGLARVIGVVVLLLLTAFGWTLWRRGNVAAGPQREGETSGVIPGAGADAPPNATPSATLGAAPTLAAEPVPPAAPVATTTAQTKQLPVALGAPGPGRAKPGKLKRDRRDGRVAPDPAAMAGVARLTVGAEPYALVRINGREVGTTPIFELEVPAGTLEIELLAPDTRTVRLRRQLTVGDGEHRQLTIP